MPKIVVTDANFPDLNHERAVANRHGAALEVARCLSPQDVVSAAAGADVLLVQFAAVTGAAIERLAPGAAIVRYGIGLDNIDLAAARRYRVRVAYVPDYATGEVADHTAALALTALRKLVSLDRSLRNGQWDPVGTARPMKSLSQSLLGMVGFGRISREVFARLKPFGFKAIAADPFADSAEMVRLGVDRVDLDTVFSRADVVTLHAPLTSDTHHIVDRHRLSLMKPTAVLVNTARGGLIDTNALVEALTAGTIAGAALDVYEDEPLPPSSSLRRAPNVLLTPHVAWYSDRSGERVQQLAADEVDRHLSNRPARCPAPDS